MTYFDPSLDPEPIAEQNNDPILPEERFVFELVGFERSQPDQYRKEGGVKWSWRVFYEDGATPFIFNDEQYVLWRTTNIDKRTMKPLFTVGTQAHDWASALLGRTLGVDDQVRVSELHRKRFSAMVVWEKQKTDPKKKSVKLASLRHIPVRELVGAGVGGGYATRPADPSSPDAEFTANGDDRDLVISKLRKQIDRLIKFDEAAGAAAREAFSQSGGGDVTKARLDDLEDLLGQVNAAIKKAMSDD